MGGGFFSITGALWLSGSKFCKNLNLLNISIPSVFSFLFFYGSYGWITE